MSAIAKLQLAVVWKAMYVKWLCNGNSDCNERKYTASTRPQPSQLASHGQPRPATASHDRPATTAPAQAQSAFITRVTTGKQEGEDDDRIGEVDRQQFQPI